MTITVARTLSLNSGDNAPVLCINSPFWCCTQYLAIRNTISNMAASPLNRASFKAQYDEVDAGVAEYADRVRDAASAGSNPYHTSTDGKNDARLGAAAQGAGEHEPFAQASNLRRNLERGDSRATGRLTEADPLLSHLQSERPRWKRTTTSTGTRSRFAMLDTEVWACSHRSTYHPDSSCTTSGK